MCSLFTAQQRWTATGDSTQLSHNFHSLPRPKSQIVIFNKVLSFQNTEGADWEKIPIVSFLLEEDKMSRKACPRLETKTHLVRSSDSNEMHRGHQLKQPQYQEPHISNRYDLLHYYIVLWFLSGTPAGSYIKLSRFASTSNPVMHNRRWRGFLRSSWTASVPGGNRQRNWFVFFVQFRFPGDGDSLIVDGVNQFAYIWLLCLSSFPITLIRQIWHFAFGLNK